ncbi:MAG: uroporphyrinogen decarboxylase family protein [Lachnospiraceae bacterium]|nr:uroporphyrinogen decarboxylase family protein [Lachnospiraceae bacterium]MDD3615423.1 uroporphyrinogen decarboxylase family protein [Lachnospiraceae bacterium]
MSESTTNQGAQSKFSERLNRVNTAIALGTPDRVPVAPFIASYMQRAHGSSYKDIYYNYEQAGEAALKFYAEHPMCDTHLFSGFTSGLANELADSQMIDWPGKPGTMVSDYSSHQVIEREMMTQEEYPELLNDFTGFMLRKYIPRAYPSLKNLANIQLTPTVVLNTGLLSSLYSPGMQEAYELLAKIGKADADASAAGKMYQQKLGEMGFPGLITGISEAPYDILGDYFRSTMGIFEDLIDEDMQEYIEQACDMFANQQIANLQYFRYVDMPVKRVFFPLHKAMDGFMSAEQYERLYWKPLKKIMMALIDMGVTPYIYTEGPYNSRLEQLTDVPKGKVLYHFETVDMKEAKRILGGTACICGNLSISQLEFGKKEDVVEQTKRLLDDCMPGGGYIFDFNGSLENCKPENLDAMFETLDKYGKY